MHFSIRISVLLLALITFIKADLNDRLDCYLESKLFSNYDFEVHLWN
jgi:hypothetical protein